MPSAIPTALLFSQALKAVPVKLCSGRSTKLNDASRCPQKLPDLTQMPSDRFKLIWLLRPHRHQGGRTVISAEHKDLP